MLFDSHTHINNDNYTPDDRKRIMEEIENSDVSFAMDVGFDWESSLRAVENAKKEPWCHAVIGVHPHDSKTMNDEMLANLEKLALEHPKVKAIGEIGLDYHYDLSDRDVQRHWFRQQIRLANKLKMPMVIHSRDADRETLEILKEEGAFSEERKSWFSERPTPKGETAYFISSKTDGGKIKKTVDFSKCVQDARVDIHCFSGSRELAIEYIKLGATIGVDGPITFKNNRKTTEVVEAIPLEFIMAETDSPYLTPVPFRGKPNKTPYVKYIVEKIAQIKGISYEEAAKMTLENGKRFFNI